MGKNEIFHILFFGTKHNYYDEYHHLDTRIAKNAEEVTRLDWISIDKRVLIRNQELAYFNNWSWPVMIGYWFYIFEIELKTTKYSSVVQVLYIIFYIILNLILANITCYTNHNILIGFLIIFQIPSWITNEIIFA